MSGREPGALIMPTPAGPSRLGGLGLGSGRPSAPTRTSARCAAGTATPVSTPPTSRSTRSRCSRRWYEAAVDAGLHEPNAMVLATVSAEGRPSSPGGAAQGPRRAGVRVLHQLRLAQGPGDGREPCGVAAVPLVRPAASGAHGGHGLPGRGRGDRGVLRHSAARRRNSARGPPPQSRVVASRSALDERLRRSAGAVRRRGDVPCLPYWGGFRVARTPWSSGRAAAAGCTTGCSTGARGRTRTRPGRSSDLRRSSPCRFTR